MSGIAILFPGQGAQHVGMGKDLSEKYPICRELYERAGEILGRDLAKICCVGPESELTRSDNAQAGIFVTSAACITALRQERGDLAAVAAAGLSLGEYTALYFAGVLSFEDTLKVLEARGQFMQAACDAQPGSMLSAIGLDLGVLQEICTKTGAEIANINCPGQIVLSGPVAAIDQAEPLVKAAGARMAIRLNVAGAFHSSLMTPAADKLEGFLDGIQFNAPTCPVYSNVTGAPHGDPDAIKAQMVAQVNSPVQWVKTIENMVAVGVDSYVECGPGKVLTGLVKRIDKPARKVNIFDIQSLEAALETI